METNPAIDPWIRLYSTHRWATVIEEIVPLLPTDMAHEVLDFGLHLRLNELKRVLQEKIDEASQGADVLLLGYGLCMVFSLSLDRF